MQTVELDYQSLHPYMLYAIAGINPGQTDLYDISEYTDIDEEEFFNITSIKFRKFVKKLTLIMINKGSKRNSAHKPLIEQIEEDYVLTEKCKNYLTKDLVNSISKSILDKHCGIEEYFYCKGKVFNGDRDLMNIDSEICAKIRKLFLAKKLGIISLHDSFVVDVHHEDLLLESMVTIFKEVLNCDFAPPVSRIELGRDEHVYRFN